MNRTRLIKWLRISASVALLIPCLLLIGLWVRSYEWHEGLHFYYGQWRSIHFWSQGGVAFISFLNNFSDGPFFTRHSAQIAFVQTGGYKPSLVPYLEFTEYGSNFLLPFWLLISLSAALAYVPWLPWWSTRFSLRTLLIMMTIVAALLGMGVWMVRWQDHRPVRPRNPRQQDYSPSLAISGRDAVRTALHNGTILGAFK